VVADILETTIRKKNQLVFEHWGEERVVDIVGPDGARYWVRFTGKQIRVILKTPIPLKLGIKLVWL